jgi:hypothetical protein
LRSVLNEINFKYMKKIILFLGNVIIVSNLIAQSGTITYNSGTQDATFNCTGCSGTYFYEYTSGPSNTVTSASTTLNPLTISSAGGIKNFKVSNTSSTGSWTDIRVATTGLPVELTLFKNNDNYLIWQTASEKNNKGFEIYKSEDGKIWNQDGFVMGSNNSVTINNYTYLTTDKTSMYYRLRQVDFDDQIEWLPIIFVKRSGEAEKRYFDLNGNDKGPFYIQEGKKFQELR